MIHCVMRVRVVLDHTVIITSGEKSAHRTRTSEVLEGMFWVPGTDWFCWFCVTNIKLDLRVVLMGLTEELTPNSVLVQIRLWTQNSEHEPRGNGSMGVT